MKLSSRWLFGKVCASLGVISFGLVGRVDADEATLNRDTWGVPHIVASQEVDGFFALGYAQAEDRLEDVYLAIRTGIGRMAEVKGKDFVQQDYMMRLARNDTLHQAYLESAPAHLKDALVAFTAGIQSYIDTHPDEAKEVAIPVKPWHPLAVGRAMILRWPIGTIMDDLKNGAQRAQPAMGSNQWAVAPSRSEDGTAILLSDPHLTWEGLAVLYEARVHAGDMHMNGYYLIGSPMLAIGHNQRVGWALTTGGPDTSDVYQIKMRMSPQPQYEYDGQWKSMEVQSFVIPVQGGQSVSLPALYTHLGPVVGEPDVKSGVAYVGASPYFEQTGLYDQFYRITKAKNVHEVNQALALHQYNEQNVMSADVEGNISYVRNGATPIRPDGFDWTRPVDGTTSKTAWLGIHPQSDLVRILNPVQGYMQNCNISPANMMVDSPLTPEKYRNYIYNVSWDQNNPRGRRTIELLHNDRSVTREEAMSYAMDTFDRIAKRWQSELRLAWEVAPKELAENAELLDGVNAILGWDGYFKADETATVLYKFWRLKCGDQCDLTPMANEKPLPAETRMKLLQLLKETMGELKSRYGKWDKKWGEVHVVGRGDKYFPASGTDFSSGNKEANFSETLLDVRSIEDPKKPGRYVANSGSMAMILMFFDKKGVSSYTCTPWGQSANPDSPHFMDQGEHLYGPRQMKPTWWDPEELRAHIKTSKALKYKN
jgi:acyl-homoserine-lactone acylase